MYMNHLAQLSLIKHKYHLGGFHLGFPTGRDSLASRDKGTENSSLFRDKGTTGQAQNLAVGRAGMGFWHFATGQAGIVFWNFATGRDTGQKEKKRKKLQFMIFFFFWQFLYFFEIFLLMRWGSDFVPGRPWTEDFVPGFLLLPLFWDKGTTGQ